MSYTLTRRDVSYTFTPTMWGVRVHLDDCGTHRDRDMLYSEARDWWTDLKLVGYKRV